MVFGDGSLPYTIAPCPLCGAPTADVLHLLLRCSANSDLYKAWAARTGTGSAHLDDQHLCNLLFAGRLGHPQPDGDKAAARVCFVGEAFQRVAKAMSNEAQSQAFMDTPITQAASSAM